jgi:prolyl-tRNA synthetase
MDEIQAKLDAKQAEVGSLGMQMKNLRASDGSTEEIDACKAAMKQAAADMKALRAELKKLKPKAAKKKNNKKKKAKGESKESGLGITAKKAEDFPRWYSDVIKKSEMVDSYLVSGCYILRPWAFNIWENITEWFDSEIKKLGVKNAMFPLFVTKGQLTKEEDHVEGFAPEVAWVTKSGDNELAEPIALRPTSETIMYPYFSKWIRSHRDLPLKLNQWTNVVRWEFKNPTPFIRTREFLWQEGHTAFATQEEADEEVLDILDLYARVYEELMAVPVIKGRKSEKERFPGGLYTTTVEAFVSATGRSVQGATSHCLGTNFADMFDITYETEDGTEKKKVVQNSWGLSTRSIGVMIMVHGDDNGLVLPPRVAPKQVVIVWIYKAADSEEDIENMRKRANAIGDALEKSGIRVEVDHRTNKTAGWKMTHWEQKGVPLRLEIGSNEMKTNQLVVCRRFDNQKTTIAMTDVVDQCHQMLADVHDCMLDAARQDRDAHLSIVTTWEEFLVEIERGHEVLAPWCELIASEEWVKDTSKAFYADKLAAAAAAAGDKVEADDGKGLSGAAKTLCIPFAQPPMPEGQLCFTSQEGSPGLGKKATVWCLWGRSY